MDREIYLETSDGGLSWWFAQNVYHVEDICRAVKSGEGSGNIPKILIEYEI